MKKLKINKWFKHFLGDLQMLLNVILCTSGTIHLQPVHSQIWCRSPANISIIYLSIYLSIYHSTHLQQVHSQIWCRSPANISIIYISIYISIYLPISSKSIPRLPFTCKYWYNLSIDSI